MFTGIVEAVGTVRAVERRADHVRLRVDLGPVAAGARAGDSVAVAGVCLTLAKGPAGTEGAFDAVAETLSRTTLGTLAPGSRVNLEGALRVGDRLGGHFVQGHVDGVGTVRSMEGSPGTPGEGAVVLSVAAPPVVVEHLIEKGSVAVDGVSLTVVALDAEGFTVALVPHTLGVTTLAALRPGDRVNLEADLLGKWVRRILGRASAGEAPAEVSRVTRALLEEEGFR